MKGHDDNPVLIAPLEEDPGDGFICPECALASLYITSGARFCDKLMVLQAQKEGDRSGFPSGAKIWSRNVIFNP